MHPRKVSKTFQKPSVAGATGWELPAGSASLVFTCQAVHWFDIPAFYAEADRALAPGGVLAVAGYDFTDAAPEVKGRDRLVELRKRVRLLSTRLSNFTFPQQSSPLRFTK